VCNVYIDENNASLKEAEFIRGISSACVLNSSLTPWNSISDIILSTEGGSVWSCWGLERL